jgi:hypothetical protein
VRAISWAIRGLDRAAAATSALAQTATPDGSASSTSHGAAAINPYDLVFHMRSDDGKLAPADVKTVWHGILRSTLKGDDLKKLGPDD